MKRGNDRDGRRAVFVMEQLEGRALMSAGGIYALIAVIDFRSDGSGSSQDIASQSNRDHHARDAAGASAPSAAAGRPAMPRPRRACRGVYWASEVRLH